MEHPDSWFQCCLIKKKVFLFRFLFFFEDIFAVFFTGCFFSLQDNRHVRGLLHRWAAFLLSVRPDWLLQLCVVSTERGETAIAGGAPRGEAESKTAAGPPAASHKRFPFRRLSPGLIFNRFLKPFHGLSDMTLHGVVCSYPLAAGLENDTLGNTPCANVVHPFDS